MSDLVETTAIAAAATQHAPGCHATAPTEDRPDGGCWCGAWMRGLKGRTLIPDTLVVDMPDDNDDDEPVISRVPTLPMRPIGSIEVELQDVLGAIEFLEHIARILRNKLTEAEATGLPVKVRVRVE